MTHSRLKEFLISTKLRLFKSNFFRDSLEKMAVESFTPQEQTLLRELTTSETMPVLFKLVEVYKQILADEAFYVNGADKKVLLAEQGKGVNAFIHLLNDKFCPLRGEEIKMSRDNSVK